MPIIIKNRQDGLTNFHLYYGIPKRNKTLFNYSPEFKRLISIDRKPIYGELCKAIAKLFHDQKFLFNNKFLAFSSQQGYPNFYGKFQTTPPQGDRLLDLNYACWLLRVAVVSPLGISQQNQEWGDLILSYGTSPTPGVSQNGIFMDNGFRSVIHTFPSFSPRKGDLMYNPATDYMITFGINSPIECKISIIIYGQNRLSQRDRERQYAMYGKKFQSNIIYSHTGEHVYSLDKWHKYFSNVFKGQYNPDILRDSFPDYARDTTNVYMNATFDSDGEFSPWFYEGYVDKNKEGCFRQSQIINDCKTPLVMLAAVIHAIKPIEGNWEKI